MSGVIETLHPREGERELGELPRRDLALPHQLRLTRYAGEGEVVIEHRRSLTRTRRGWRVAETTVRWMKRHPSLDERLDPAVHIVEHDPAWLVQARQEMRRLREALGPVAVRLEHVGSTAVSGLAAKPILDLQLSVAAIKPRAPYVEPLERLGYLFVPAPRSPDHHFFARPPERPRTHHLHVCAVGSEHELRHLAVRDFLRAHAEEAAEYAALKREVAARHPQDRLAYIAGKEEYVAALEARAVAWARGRS
jgi:GrpB-like predicted nucleotidyltransferase (UPF0157 family)